MLMFSYEKQYYKVLKAPHYVSCVLVTKNNGDAKSLLFHSCILNIDLLPRNLGSYLSIKHFLMLLWHSLATWILLQTKLTPVAVSQCQGHRAWGVDMASKLSRSQSNISGFQWMKLEPQRPHPVTQMTHRTLCQCCCATYPPEVLLPYIYRSETFEWHNWNKLDLHNWYGIYFFMLSWYFTGLYHIIID